MNFPNAPSGSDDATMWLRRQLEAARSKQLLPGRGYRLRETTNGLILEIEPPSGSAAVLIGCYRFKSHQGNYVTCRSWDGTSEGTEDVLIAKPPELWFSVATETLRGDFIGYSGYDLVNQSRLATRSDGVVEYQVIDRAYTTAASNGNSDDLIWATPGFSGVNHPITGKDLGLIDLNRGSRAWLTKP